MKDFILILAIALSVGVPTWVISINDLTEIALQSAFNEGVSHGTCLAIKGRVSAEEMDKCWEKKDD